MLRWVFVCRNHALGNSTCVSGWRWQGLQEAPLERGNCKASGGNESWKAVFLSLRAGSLLCGMAALKVTQRLERCSAIKRACCEFDSHPLYIGQLTTVCNYGSRGSWCPFWHL